MNEDYSYKEAFIHHRDSQNKFDYYFLGVILAALSLSIQTYDSTKEPNDTSLIIISWVLFLFSFLAGFFRQERNNLAYMVTTEKIRQKKKLELFNNAQLGLVTLQKSVDDLWTKEEIKKSLENINDVINLSDHYIRKYEKHTLWAYQIQKWMFFYASYFYILFKVANSIALSICHVVIISVVVAVINLSLVKLYKSLLKKESAL